MSSINKVFERLSSACERYKQQKQRAKDRGIEWQFSFEDWLGMWINSGKWDLRGKGSGKFVMSRAGDVGPYSPSNCRIASFEENIKEGGGRGAGRGWTLVKGRYQVMVGTTYVGRFKTVEEAESAYLNARQNHLCARTCR